MIMGCDKEGPGDNYNFDNKVPPYVALSSTAEVNIEEGATAIIPLEVRTAIQEDLTITLSVSGAINADQTVVLSKGTMSVDAELPIPAGTVVPPATAATATVSLSRAISAGGIEFSIGRLNNPETQKKVLNITLP